MQYRITLLALIAAASAQSLADLPTCATSCVNKGLPSNCNLDPSCICSSSSFIDAISCCVSKACDKADQDATLKFAHGICDPVGVTNLPTAATCTGAAAATASGASSGSATSSAGTMTTSMASSAASGASSSASSVSASVSSELSSVSSSVSSVVSGASSSAAAASTTSGGAAAGLAVQGVGAVGAGLLGLAALL